MRSAAVAFGKDMTWSESGRIVADMLQAIDGDLMEEVASASEEDYSSAGKVRTLGPGGN